MNYNKLIAFTATLTAAILGNINNVYAQSQQSVPINYDSLSFAEEPLAVPLGPATLNANVLLDQAVQYNSETEEDTYNTRVNASLGLGVQLPNSWQARVQYVANFNRLDDDKYTDNVSVSLSDEWGTLAGGNVTGSVREKTRRQRGAGNAVLANDDFIGALDETGAFYSVRYNSYELAITADKEGRAEAGIMFERPIGQSNYFVSGRIRKGDTSENSDISDKADTIGGALVTEYSYASFTVDAQIAYENIEAAASTQKQDHVFGSMGMQYKRGAYSASIEGGAGRYDGQDRRAAAIGARVDIARGASFNVGVNYNHSNNNDDVTSLASMRYEF